MQCQRKTTKGQQCSAKLQGGRCRYHGLKAPTPAPEKVNVLPVTIPKSLAFVDYLELRLGDNGLGNEGFFNAQRESLRFADPEVAGYAWGRFLDRCGTLKEEERRVLSSSLREFFNPVPS